MRGSLKAQSEDDRCKSAKSKSRDAIHKSGKAKSRGSTKGHSLIEFVLATIIVIPIVLLFIDCYLVLGAIHINDMKCREAARLVASGDPRQAVVRAFQIVAESPETSPQSKFPKASSLSSSSDSLGQQRYSMRLVAAESNVTPAQIEALAPYGGQVAGIATVSTEIEVKPFILNCLLAGEPLRFRTTQAFPCTYVVPNVAAPDS